MEKLYQSSKTRLGADCVSDHELLIAKFRLSIRDRSISFCALAVSLLMRVRYKE